MRKIAVLLVLLLAMACATEQTSTYDEEGTSTNKTTSPSKKVMADNDWAKKNLKGAVKERTVWVYGPDATGKIDEKALRGGIEVTYNEVGNKLTWKSYDEKKQLLDAWEYVYDNQNRLTERKTVNGPVMRLFTYRYSPEGQLEQSEERANDVVVKTTTYQYDEQGNMILSYSYFEDSGSESRRKQRFDEQGQLKEVQVYDENNVVQFKKMYAYNEQGKTSEQAVYSGANIPSYKRKFSYDDKGNLLTDVGYMEDGQLNERDAYQYQYTYDKQGNWLTTTKTNREGQPLEYSTQTVVYFR